MTNAIVVFLRGVNVGGYKTFRPSVLARELAAYDVVNVGAAGTFVVRKPGSRAKFRAALLRRLPFDCDVVLRDGRELVRLAARDPFRGERPRRDVVRFVSFLVRARRPRAPVPMRLPPQGPWLLRVIAADTRFVLGTYRRRMQAIGSLGQLDKLFGRATVRNWTTVEAVVRLLLRP